MIRLATINDLDAVLGLYQELRPHDPQLDRAFAAQQWAEIINDSKTDIIVADVAGTLASTCALSLNLSIANGARPFGMIEHVITAKSHRRQGLSREVLAYAIELAWQKNCYKVMLLSGEQLHGAHKLYESVGFKGGIEKGFVIKPSLG